MVTMVNNSLAGTPIKAYGLVNRALNIPRAPTSDIEVEVEVLRKGMGQDET